MMTDMKKKLPATLSLPVYPRIVMGYAVYWVAMTALMLVSFVLHMTLSSNVGLVAGIVYEFYAPFMGMGMLVACMCYVVTFYMKEVMKKPVSQ